MKPERTRIYLLACLLSFSALALSCVTVNVNLPEAAVQQATDDYVRELYQTKQKGKPPTPAPTPSEPTKSTSHYWPLIENTAWADGELLVRSPKVEQVKQRQAARLGEINSAKSKGILGESNDGMLVLKESGQLGELLKKKLKETVSDENADRKELYADIKKRNSLDSGGLNRLKEHFARSFQAASPAGTWIQSPDGNWSQKP